MSGRDFSFAWMRQLPRTKVLFFSEDKDPLLLCGAARARKPSVCERRKMEGTGTCRVAASADMRFMGACAGRGHGHVCRGRRLAGFFYRCHKPLNTWPPLKERTRGARSCACSLSSIPSRETLARCPVAWNHGVNVWARAGERSSEREPAAGDGRPRAA